MRVTIVVDLKRISGPRGVGADEVGDALAEEISGVGEIYLTGADNDEETGFEITSAEPSV